MRRARVAVVVAFVLAISVARAEERPVREFSARVSSTAECPAKDSFSRRVLARTARARETTSPSPDVGFVLFVEIDPEGASGTLEVTEGSARSVRNVRGATCEEVVDALALIAAVTLDPEASTQPISLESDPPAQSAPTGPAGEAAGPGPGPTISPPSATPGDAPRARSVPEKTDGGPSWRLGGGVRGALTEGLAPDPTFALGAFVSARLPGDGSPFEPLFVLGAWLARSGEYDATVGDVQLGTAQFRWLAGELAGCPLRLPVEGAFALRPCVGIEIGRLTGKGRAPRNSAEESATWFATSASLRLDWTLFDRLEIELSGGGFLSLARDDFFFEPATGTAGEGVVVHEVPSTGLRAGIGVGVVLP